MGTTRRPTADHQLLKDTADNESAGHQLAVEAGSESLDEHKAEQQEGARTATGMSELHDQVLVSLRRIIRATDLNSRKLGKETGLTTPQLVVMAAIRQHDTVVPSEIARTVSLSQATVTNILNRLESHELISRERSVEDKRRVNISLTEEGQALLESAPEPLQQSFVERFGSLPVWEQHQLVASLERLASLMDAEHIDASPFLTASEEMH